MEKTLEWMLAAAVHPGCSFSFPPPAAVGRICLHAVKILWLGGCSLLLLATLCLEVVDPMLIPVGLSGRFGTSSFAPSNNGRK